MILIDVTRLVVRFRAGRLATGVDRVGLAYVRHYRSQAQALIRWAGRSWVLPAKQSQQLFAWLLQPTSKHFALRMIIQGIILGGYRHSWPGALLFNTGHSGLELTQYPAMIKKMRVRPLFVLHDLIPITHPEYCRGNEDAKHVIRMTRMLELAVGIVTNSEATRQDLIGFAQQSKTPLPPTVTAWLAPEMAGIKAQKRLIAAPYFVLLSTIEPRKNHVLILQIWRRLVEQMGDNAPRLVVIGQRGWECENVIDLLERCQSLKGVVFELNTCTDADLVAYLRHAQALLFPSFAEGYGMPLIEALSLGVPVIASDLPVFHEVAKDIPEYIDPLDGKQWLACIMNYLTPHSVQRQAQLERILHFVVPSWAAHFERVDALIAKLSTTNPAGE